MSKDKIPIEHAKHIQKVYVDWATNSNGILASNTEHIAKDVIEFMLNECETCKKTKGWRR